MDWRVGWHALGAELRHGAPDQAVRRPSKVVTVDAGVTVDAELVSV